VRAANMAFIATSQHMWDWEMAERLLAAKSVEANATDQERGLQQGRSHFIDDQAISAGNSSPTAGRMDETGRWGGAARMSAFTRNSAHENVRVARRRCCGRAR